MSKKKLFIFAADGTLVNAYTAIAKSLNFTRRAFDYPPVSLREVKRKVGRGDKLFVQSFFPPSIVRRALKLYRVHHRKSVIKYSKLMPYAKYLLRSLKRRKKILAIASNRPKRFTRLVLDKVGIRRYFDVILCADEVGKLKPHPKILHTVVKNTGVARDEAVYLGDMDIDLETAHRAKIDSVFVRGGSSTLGDVKNYHKKKVVRSLREVLGLYE